MPDFKIDGWSYDPMCKPSPSGAHYWILEASGHGRCRHCEMEQQFHARTTNGPRPTSRAYSIRGGKTAAKRGK
jgi:hypothetical protein